MELLNTDSQEDPGRAHNADACKYEEHSVRQLSTYSLSSNTPEPRSNPEDTPEPDNIVEEKSNALGKPDPPGAMPVVSIKADEQRSLSDADSCKKSLPGVIFVKQKSDDSILVSEGVAGDVSVEASTTVTNHDLKLDKGKKRPGRGQAEILNVNDLCESQQVPPVDNARHMLYHGDAKRSLTWRSVNMSIPASQTCTERKLLRDCWGEVPSRQTTAIMGASGAGKTSLLNILAGRLRTTRSLVVSADVRVNNYSVDPLSIAIRQYIAFVAQDDSLPATSTPRECLRFSATLRLPRATSKTEIEALTSCMIEELGLEKCADVLVGGPLIKGISGGERKRTSIGVELVTKPSIVFLDEPTSGLDSYSALQCCEVMRQVAKSGASVLFTIHQPSSEIFSAFDHLILMHKGRVMYHGSAMNVQAWFRCRGHPVPKNYNAADWIIDVAQANSLADLERDGFFPVDSRPRIQELHNKDASELFSNHDSKSLTAPRMTQVTELFKRNLHSLRRDWSIVFIKGFLTGFLAAFIGAVFFGIGDAEATNRIGVQNQFGSLMVILMVSQMTAVQMTTFTYPEERPIFLREYSTRHYDVLSYISSHLVMEMVITALQTLISISITYHMIAFSGGFYTVYLAAYGLALATAAQTLCVAALVGENIALAMQITPLVSIPQMLFAGFFVAADILPPWLSWAQYFCTITYSARILAINEFDDCSDLAPCESVLTSTKANPDEFWFYWAAIVVIFVVFRLLALLLLQRSAMQFY